MELAGSLVWHEKAYSEVFRILKSGGHFSISDIVYSGYLPDEILEAAELYAGCVSGASEKGTYLGIIKSAGFKNIQIKKERLIDLPDDLLSKYLDDNRLEEFKKSDSGIYSITVYADKLDEGNCCESVENECCGSETGENENAEDASCCGSNTESSSSCCG